MSSVLVRAVALGFAMTLASVAVLASREATLGHEQLAAADRDAARGDWPDAIAHARAAARAQLPGSPWPARAARRLGELAHQAELRGDDDTALMAYGALRAAALSARAIGSNEASWRGAAEEGVARIAARRGGSGSATVPGVPEPEDHAASVRAALGTEDSPPTRTLAGLNAAAIAMVGALSYLALGGPNPPWRAAARALFAGGLLIHAVVLLMN
ncbi:MAG TPA: hypothetical protein VEK07_22525 [Polyangiaceae bacterium]|nr:hypothetical protein [Polyangiaceae bacterium]